MAALDSKVEKARQVVQEWMFEKSLEYFVTCRYKGVTEFFAELRKRNIGIGVFSEYPAFRKLEALQLTPDVIVCSTDKEVDRLKPDPKGLLVTAAKLQTPVRACLFIGDRYEKDGECARRAGMPYLILDRKNRERSNTIHSLARIEDWPDTCAH